MTITPSKETFEQIVRLTHNLDGPWLRDYNDVDPKHTYQDPATEQAWILFQTAVMQLKEVMELVNAAQRLLNERDRMVVSGDYNSLAGVSHILRVGLRPFTPTNEAEDE